MAYVQLAVGIEVDCFLALHELVLEPVSRRDGSRTEIVKDLSKEDRIHLADGGIRSTSDQIMGIPHQNWGLTNPQPDEIDFPCGTTTDLSIPSYCNEPLTIVAVIIDPPITAKVHSRLWTMISHSSFWKVGYDEDLSGVSEEALLKYLGPQTTAKELGDWDCVGIRLISNRLPAPASSMDSEAPDEIAKVIKLLRGSASQGYRTFVTEQCGIRVRLGISEISPPQEGPGCILQYLTYILVLYDNEIYSFHPP